LSDDYPHELTGLASNLDRFIEHETASRARYRNALDDLAHSLKTPLAVIRNALGESGQFDRPLLLEQLSRMETTVSHQLTRAASSGPVVVGHLVPVRAVAERLARALRTAFRERELHIEIIGEAELAFRGDERDLLELLGNLLENACKYTHRQVRLEVQPTGRVDLAVVLHVDDDGPGIPEAQQRQMLARGARGDTALQGQGIGLSVVVELVSLYGGELELGSSKLGGARVTLRLPGQLVTGGE
jgi:two-component system sensor histidine kinase PhoQ